MWIRLHFQCGAIGKTYKCILWNPFFLFCFYTTNGKIKYINVYNRTMAERRVKIITKEHRVTKFMHNFHLKLDRTRRWNICLKGTYDKKVYIIITIQLIFKCLKAVVFCFTRFKVYYFELRNKFILKTKYDYLQHMLSTNCANLESKSI